jgi:hypothetical protein
MATQSFAKTGYSATLEPALRDPVYVPPVYDLRKNQLTLAERMRMNRRDAQITRAEAMRLGYDQAEIDRLLPNETQKETNDAAI